MSSLDASESAAGTYCPTPPVSTHQLSVTSGTGHGDDTHSSDVNISTSGWQVVAGNGVPTAGNGVATDSEAESPVRWDAEELLTDVQSSSADKNDRQQGGTSLTADDEVELSVCADSDSQVTHCRESDGDVERYRRDVCVSLRHDDCQSVTDDTDRRDKVSTDADTPLLTPSNDDVQLSLTSSVGDVDRVSDVTTVGTLSAVMLETEQRSDSLSAPDGELQVSNASTADVIVNERLLYDKLDAFSGSAADRDRDSIVSITDKQDGTCQLQAVVADICSEYPVDKAAVIDTPVDKSALAESPLDKRVLTDTPVDKSALVISPLDKTDSQVPPADKTAPIECLSTVDRAAHVAYLVDKTDSVDCLVDKAVLMDSLTDRADSDSPSAVDKAVAVDDSQPHHTEDPCVSDVLEHTANVDTAAMSQDSINTSALSQAGIDTTAASQGSVDTVASVDSKDLTNCSANNVSIDLFSTYNSQQSEVDCSSAALDATETAAAAVTTETEARLCEEPHCVMMRQVDSDNTALDMSYGSEQRSAADAVVTYSFVSESTSHAADLGRRNDTHLTEHSRDDERNDRITEPSSAASAVPCIINECAARTEVHDQPSSAESAVPCIINECAARTEVHDTTNQTDSKCLAINPSLAQTSQLSTAVSSQLCTGEADNLKLASDDADNHSTTLCSKQRYVTGVDTNVSTFVTQPLKSLADLVQKVSVSASDASEPPASMKNLLSPRDMESLLDAAVMRNSPLFSGRVGYMAACPSGRGGRRAALRPSLQQHSTEEQNSPGHVTGTAEFKKPAPCSPQLTAISTTPRRPDIEVPLVNNHNGEISAVSYQAGSSVGAIVDGSRTSKSAALKRGCQSSPGRKNIVRDQSETGTMAEDGNLSSAKGAAGRRDKKSSTGHRRDRVKKCEADMVDGKLLKDLIVACGSDGVTCGSDGVAASCRLGPPSDASTAETTESSKQNKTSPTLGDDTATLGECKQSATEPKQRKGGTALQRRKTTKLLNDITLIDVAAVKSCVEKDYSEFIRSIQQSPDNNTASDESKGTKNKRKKKKNDNVENLAVEGAENQKEGCSLKNRRKRNKVLDGNAEQSMKGTRSRSKKRHPQNDVDASVPVDKCPELSAADPANCTINDDDSMHPTNDEPLNFAVPNSSRPTDRKNGTAARKKKKAGLQKVEKGMIEVKNGAETRSHRKAAASQSQEASQETMQLNNIEDGLTEGNVVAMLNTFVNDSSGPPRIHEVTNAARTKKGRPSKKKPGELLDAGGSGIVVDHCQSDTAVDCTTPGGAVGGKSRKRKSRTRSPATMDNTSTEPSAKHSRNTASLESTCTLDRGAEPRVLDSSTAGVAGLHCQILPSLQHPACSSEGKTSHKKVQKTKKKKSCIEVVNETGVTTHVAETKTSFAIHTETKTTDVCIESGQQLTDDSSPLNSQTAGTSATDGNEFASQLANTEQTGPSELDHSTAVEGGSCLVAEASGKDGDADEQKLFSCTRCSYRARKKGQLRKHLSVHKVFNCAHCEFSADTQGGLDDHMSTKHPSRCGRRLCKRCHMLFRAGKAFTEHVEQCNGVKLSWQCPQCGKDFKFISAMRTHVHRWHGGASDVVIHTDMTANTTDIAEDQLQANTMQTVDIGLLEANTTEGVTTTSLKLSPAVISVGSETPLSYPGPVTVTQMVPGAGPGPVPSLGQGSVPHTGQVPGGGQGSVPAAGPVPVPGIGPLPSAEAVPGIEAGSVPAAGPVPVPSAGPLGGTGAESVDAMTVDSSRGDVKHQSSVLPAVTTCNNVSSAQTTEPLLTSYCLPVVDAAAPEPGTGRSSDIELSCTGNQSTLDGELQAGRQTVTTSKHTSLSSSASTVTVDGELRYLCDHCPKSFKAKRSMVHHRRMIHEGGRLRKKQAAAAAANNADGEKTKVDDEVDRSVDRAERLESEVVQTVSSLPHNTLHRDQLSAGPEAGAHTHPGPEAAARPHPGPEAAAYPHPHPDAVAAASTVAIAGVVHRSYSCSFTGCCQTFKRPSQLQRHEEKHAGPGTHQPLWHCNYSL